MFLFTSLILTLNFRALDPLFSALSLSLIDSLASIRKCWWKTYKCVEKATHKASGQVSDNEKMVSMEGLSLGDLTRPGVRFFKSVRKSLYIYYWSANRV